ncbi:hypothetical protein ACHAPT_007903 [Fusarium lateritium]
MFSRIKDKLSSSSSSKRRPSGGALNSNNPFADDFTDAPPAYSPVDENRSRDRKPTHIDVGSSRRGASPSPSIVSNATPEDKYAFLSNFDTIFVIDDSGSMSGSLWKETRDALAAITPICTSHDPDGIDVYFLNHRSGDEGSGNQASGGYYNIRDAQQVKRLFNSVRPVGSTPTGKRLQSILKPYMDSLRPDNMESIKPINIIVITDGAASDDPESIIVQHARKLDKLEAVPHQVGIQFFQVGDDPKAAADLLQLDNGLAQNKIRDMVDTAAWDEDALKVGGEVVKQGSNVLEADVLLKVVLGAVVRRLDRQSIPKSKNSRRR